jgi:spore maturation protein CgeB
VVGSTCAALYSAAQVSLNIVDDLNMPGHNMRTFEIPGSGGVMLASYTKEQAEFFPEDDAAVYYRDSSELDAKIDRIISNAEFRARIRHQALEASSRHSYTERVAELLASCGFRRQGG